LPFEGKRRGRNVLYDLRTLQQDKSSQETMVTISWNYQELALLSFRNLQHRKSIVVKDFHDLARATIEAGFFTVEDFPQYLHSKIQENDKYRDRLRNRREID